MKHKQENDASSSFTKYYLSEYIPQKRNMRIRHFNFI